MNSIVLKAIIVVVVFPAFYFVAVMPPMVLAIILVKLIPSIGENSAAMTILGWMAVFIGAAGSAYMCRMIWPKQEPGGGEAEGE